MPKLSKKFMATVAPALGILGVTSVTAEAEVAATATEPVQPTPQPAAPALAGTGEAVTPPKVETPNANLPGEAPKAEAPKAEAPKAEAPKAEAPKAEAPKAEAPKAEAPEAEAPKAEAPKTSDTVVTPSVQPTKPTDAPETPHQVDVTPSRAGEEVKPIEAVERKEADTQGHIDVYVDHAKVDDAIDKAVAVGVNIHRSETVVLEGNGKETTANTAKAVDYYTAKEKEITKAADDYKTTLHNWEVDKASMNGQIAKANVEVGGYIAKLAQLGRQTTNLSKEFSEAVFEADKNKLKAELAKPVTTENKTTPVPVYTYIMPNKLLTKPVPPTVEYHYYDVRAKLESKPGAQNRDGEQIEGEKEIIPVLKNQTVVAKSQNEALPANRFDKIHSIVQYVTLPQGVELDEEVFKSSQDWRVSYDKESRQATVEATPKYLVKVNARQNVNNGQTGGTAAKDFNYDIPGVALKVKGENKQYGIQVETLINHEYLATSKTIVLQNEQADPEKHNTATDGMVIDGKATLPGDINRYQLTLDYNQYKGSKPDRALQERGVHVYDFYPAEVVEEPTNITLKQGDKVIAIAKEDGTFVKPKAENAKPDAKDEVFEGLKWEKVTSADGLSHQGPGLHVYAEGYKNPFLTNYVFTGQNLTLSFDVKTKKTEGKDGARYGGDTYRNKFYQSDFGNFYASNQVENTTVKVNPDKDAVTSVSDLTSLDLAHNEKASIEHNGFFQYRAKGTAFPTNVGIKSYAIRDTFHAADQYDGVHFVENGHDIHFKEGSTYAKRYGVLKANSDLTKYTTQTIERNVSKDVNTAVGETGKADTVITKVTIGFDQDFLDAIDFTKTTFQVDAFMQAKRRTNTQQVTNVFEEVVNDVEFASNKVVTNTRQNAVDALNDKLGQTTDKLTGKDTEHDGRLSGHDKDLKDHKAQLDQHGQRLDGHDKDLKAQADKLANHDKQLANHDKQIGQVNDKLKPVVGHIKVPNTQVKSVDEAREYAHKIGYSDAMIKKIEQVGNDYVITYERSQLPTQPVQPIAPGHTVKPTDPNQKPQDGQKPDQGKKPQDGQKPTDGQKPDQGKKPEKPQDGQKPDQGKKPEKPQDGQKPDQGTKPQEKPQAQRTQGGYAQSGSYVQSGGYVSGYASTGGGAARGNRVVAQGTPAKPKTEKSDKTKKSRPKRLRVEFFTMTSEEEVREALKQMGLEDYSEKITSKNGTWVAELTLKGEEDVVDPKRDTEEARQITEQQLQEALRVSE